MPDAATPAEIPDPHAAAASRAPNAGAIVVDCPVCGSPEHLPLHWAVDRWMGVEGTFRYARCRACDLVYLRLRPAPRDMDRYYPSHYIRRGAGPAKLRRFFRRRDMAHRVAVTRAQPGRRVLDVGCATGEFLESVRAAGGIVAGVEPTDWAAEAAASRGLPIWPNTLADARLPENAFDVVTLWDVLEHLDDPVGDLRRVRSALRPGGRLIVTTPVLDGWEARLYGRRWPGWDTPRHLVLFSQATLAAALSDAGFDVVERTWIYESYLITAMTLGLIAREVLPPRAAALLWSLVHARPLRLLMAAPFRRLDRVLGGCWLTVVAEAREHCPTGLW